MRTRPAALPVAGILRTLALVWVILGIVMAVVAALAGEEEGLFRAAAVPENGGRPEVLAVVRSRVVEPDFDLLLGPAGGAPAAELRLNLFEDADFTAVLERVQTNASGSLSWMGRLEGVAYGSAVLVAREGIMMGTVAAPGAWYRIRYLGEGVHVVQEIDSAALPAELEPLSVVEDHRPGPAAPGSTADDGSVIDVLVVYTDDARAIVGGTTAIANLIDLAVAETNQSYANSQVTQRVALVGTAELAYDESDFDWSTTLGRLRGTTDGYLDAVHGMRDSACADEVVLLVQGDGAFCGMAYQMASVSASFASNAFAVVATNCATGYYSFGHELGHNMGARHDWYVDTNIFPYSYSHGFANAADGWRTVMAYNAGCSDQGGNCTRLPYWSNPNVLYGGDPMGVPAGTSTSCSAGTPNPGCDADNHWSLNNTAATVANFRDSSVCTPAAYSISGAVRDASGGGIEGVTVDFDGARPAVITSGGGSYSQTGFEEGDYAVRLSRSETFFSPVLDAVMVEGGSATHDAVAYVPVPSRPPVSETFETGWLGDRWAVETDYEGRVRAEALYPHGGGYSLLLDSATGTAFKSHAAGILALNLTAMTEATLTFWWQDLADEDDADDGVFVSDDYGETWYRVFSFSGYPEGVYRQDEIDLVAGASAAGMDLNDHFLVKFQFYDNNPAGTDGYAIDDVQVTGTSLHVYVPLVLMTD